MNRLSIKETSDISASDRLAYFVAAGFGAGLAPVAPGTLGSLEGVAIFLGLAALRLNQSLFAVSLLTLIAVSLAIGIWAAERTCRVTGLDDAQAIVIDEVSGQLIALLPLALWQSFSITMLVLAFLLFRLFDVVKPYPIRKLERLHGGLGVMADDVLAGIYAAGLLWLGHTIELF